MKARHFTFFPPPGLDYIRALRITGIRKKVDIDEVLVYYEDGRVRNRVNLVGTYEMGQSRTTHLTGARILRLEVTASSPSVFKSKGAFRLDAAAVRVPNNKVDVFPLGDEDHILEQPFEEGDEEEPLQP